METKEVKLYISASKFNFESEFKIQVSSYAPTSCKTITCIPLSEVTVEVEIPNVDVKQLQLAEVKQLQETIKTERANSFARITAIEEKIQSLLCIEQGE